MNNTAETTTRPNILLIHADQHRFDCLGAYGNPDIQTPNIDALAQDGVLYEASFCPFPVCTPSRYSLLSSQYVHQHLGWTNHCTLPNGIPTYAKVLRANGYKTKAVGKMHFTPTYLDVGFDEMILAEQDGPGRFDDDYHRWLREEGLIDAIDLMDQRQEFRRLAPPVYWETFGALRSNLDEAHHSTTWIAERAIETLQSWGEGGGHCLMVGFIKPHHPFDPPAPWDTMYDPDRLTLLPGWTESPSDEDLAYHAGYFPHTALTEQTLRRAMAYYYATISQIDYHVGRMVDLLRRKGLYDNTLIVYTSDHGEYMGFHHLLLKGNHMYDPLIKVPLIIKYPSQTRAGEVVTAQVTNLDVAPTLLRAAGCEVPDTMQGMDLHDASAGHAYVFAESGHGRAYMVRSKTHKLLLCRDPSQSRFYDLERDPLETDNRINDPAYQGMIDEFREVLNAWALFEAPSQTHLDEDAPVVRGDNVPHRGDGHVSSLVEYTHERMKQELKEEV